MTDNLQSSLDTLLDDVLVQEAEDTLASLERTLHTNIAWLREVHLLTGCEVVPNDSAILALLDSDIEALVMAALLAGHSLNASALA